MEKFIIFKAYMGGKRIAKVNCINNVMTLIDYENEYIESSIDLRDDSPYELDETVYADSITEITRNQYNRLKGLVKSEVAPKVSKEISITNNPNVSRTPTKIKELGSREFLSVEFWGEDWVEETTWLMSDGSERKYRKVLRSL